MWKNHGDLNFDFETDPSKVYAQCIAMRRLNADQLTHTLDT